MHAIERKNHFPSSGNTHCREREVKRIPNQQLALLIEDVYDTTNHTCKSFPRFCHGVSTVLGKLGLDVATTIALLVGKEALISGKELNITDCQLHAARQYLESMQISLELAGWKIEMDENGFQFYTFQGTNPTHWIGLLQQWSGAYFVMERFGLLEKK